MGNAIEDFNFQFAAQITMMVANAQEVTAYCQATLQILGQHRDLGQTIQMRSSEILATGGDPEMHREVMRDMFLFVQQATYLQKIYDILGTAVRQAQKVEF